MKSRFYLFFAALALHTQIAAGDDINCKATYGQALRACARSWDLLISNGRAGAQKACVEGAVLTRAYCMSGIDACLDHCQVSYEKSAAACEATFAPATCAEETRCESIILQQRDNCISNAVSGLDSCSQACP
jgi:hypothetical protein